MGPAQSKRIERELSGARARHTLRVIAQGSSLMPTKGPNLHGNAPDQCTVALLLIDFINDFEFEGATAVYPRALAAAKAVAALRGRARKAGIPVIYANDNFGKWRSDFRSLLEHCLHDGVRGQPIAE